MGTISGWSSSQLILSLLLCPCVRVRSIQGGELFFHLKNNRRFSEEVARIYVGQIALALGHLHSMSIIYRDLKPEVRARALRRRARGRGWACDRGAAAPLSAGSSDSCAQGGARHGRAKGCSLRRFASCWRG